jgi:hypothetical protein
MRILCNSRTLARRICIRNYFSIQSSAIAQIPIGGADSKSGSSYWTGTREPAVMEGVNELKIEKPSGIVHPCITARVAERSRDTAKHPLFARPGWFSDENKRYTTPAPSDSVATRSLLEDAATHPCGDARRRLSRSIPIHSRLIDRRYSLLLIASPRHRLIRGVIPGPSTNCVMGVVCFDPYFSERSVSPGIR